jgi:uncharacterized coiled-coil protein SlyX
LSDKVRENEAILSCQVEELNRILNEKTQEIKLLQENLKYLNEEVLLN